MTSMPARRLPDTSDPTTAPFWENSARHVLVAQRCAACGDTRFPYIEICPVCWSSDQSWERISTEGELWSFVVYHRALDPAMRDEVPYVIGRVVSDDGPIFNVRLDVSPEDAAVGMRVTASWDDVTEDVTLLRFTAADSENENQ
jgi:uncharacterized OB-fold protein